MDAMLYCSNCQTQYPLNDYRWWCDCGHYLDITIPTPVTLGEFTPNLPGIWRYASALPIQDPSSRISLGEGMTPILAIPIKDRTILVKQDHLSPTGSYKDRGAAVLVSHLKELGVRKVVEDSSGNAGAAIAAYCAYAGITCEIYVPEKTSPAKLAQIQGYGAALRLIPGNRSETARAVLQAATKTYYASHTWNPFFFQGTKTFAYEIFEQMGGQVPDIVVLPVGNGTLLLGAYLGFKDLAFAGLTKQVPRIIAVQAANCSPLAAKFSQAKSLPYHETMAEGIAIPEPIRAPQIINAVRETGGKFITVGEEQLYTSWKWLLRQGFCVEPTSAAAIAGIEAVISEIAQKDQILTCFTGHGLKNTDKILHLEELYSQLA